VPASSPYLFRFGYSLPAERRYCQTDPYGGLGEATAMVFVNLPSESYTLKREEVAEEFIRVLFGSYSWRELNLARWLESEPEVRSWVIDYYVPELSTTESFEIRRAAEKMVVHL